MNGIGSSDWRSQLRFRPGASGGIPNTPPIAWSRKFTAPASVSNSDRQTVATMMDGITTGRMNRARYTPRPISPLVLRRTAISTPRMTWITTLESAHHRLNRTRRMNSKFGIWSLEVAIRM